MNTKLITRVIGNIVIGIVVIGILAVPVFLFLRYSSVDEQDNTPFPTETPVATETPAATETIPVPVDLMNYLKPCISAKGDPTGKRFKGDYIGMYNISNLPSTGDIGEYKDWGDLSQNPDFLSKVDFVPNNYYDLLVNIPWSQAADPDSDLGAVLCLKVTYTTDLYCDYGELGLNQGQFISENIMATLFDWQAQEVIARINIDSNHMNACPQTLGFGLNFTDLVYMDKTADGKQSLLNALDDWLLDYVNSPTQFGPSTTPAPTPTAPTSTPLPTATATVNPAASIFETNGFKRAPDDDDLCKSPCASYISVNLDEEVQIYSDGTLTFIAFQEQGLADETTQVPAIQSILNKLYGSNEIGDWVGSHFQDAFDKASIQGHEITVDKKPWTGYPSIVITILP